MRNNVNIAKFNYVSGNMLKCSSSMRITKMVSVSVNKIFALGKMVQSYKKSVVTGSQVKFSYNYVTSKKYYKNYEFR